MKIGQEGRGEVFVKLSNAPGVGPRGAQEAMHISPRLMNGVPERRDRMCRIT